MNDFLFSDQLALSSQPIIDRFIGIEHILTGKGGDVIGESALIIDWRIDIKIILEPDFVVFLTMTRRNMNTTGSLGMGAPDSAAWSA